MPVLSGIDIAVHAGECIVLSGPSGAGKSTLMRSLYGNYRADSGAILVRHHGQMVDIAAADPRTILAVRRETLGFVSQFLRVVPRVSALDVVAEVLLARGVAAATAADKARTLLRRALQCLAEEVETLVGKAARQQAAALRHERPRRL